VTYVLAGLLALSLMMLLVERRDSRTLLAKTLEEFREERSDLLIRIQHPERVPVADVFVEPWEAPDDELELVGTIIPGELEDGF
jgi:hypothetical protein